MAKFQWLVRLSLLWAILISNGWAYVDPGSGMLMWQGLVAAIGAVLIFIRNPIQLLKSWIERLRGK